VVPSVACVGRDGSVARFDVRVEFETCVARCPAVAIPPAMPTTASTLATVVAIRARHAGWRLFGRGRVVARRGGGGGRFDIGITSEGRHP
jgi:hypothetical protein